MERDHNRIELYYRCYTRDVGYHASYSTAQTGKGFAGINGVNRRGMFFLRPIFQPLPEKTNENEEECSEDDEIPLRHLKKRKHNFAKKRKHKRTSKSVANDSASESESDSELSAAEVDEKRTTKRRVYKGGRTAKKRKLSKKLFSAKDQIINF